MTNTIIFDAWDWRDIMRVCGAAISLDEARTMLHYIKIHCEGNFFKAYATNGYQVSTIEGKCVMKDRFSPVDALILPQKTPAKTRTVELNPYVNKAGESRVSVHNLYFYDKDKNVTGTCDVEIPDGEYLDLEGKIIKPALENIGRSNHGEGQYMIAVNPKYLIAALEGMKDRDSVILNFGSPVQPFLIRPFKDDQNITALVYPVRIM